MDVPGEMPMGAPVQDRLPAGLGPEPARTRMPEGGGQAVDPAGAPAAAVAVALQPVATPPAMAGPATPQTAAAPLAAAQPSAAQPSAAQPAAANGSREPAHGMENGGAYWEPARPTCTTAQLRRFIKSRPWIPMHELRRRFGILGGDDDVTPIRVGEHTLFIGLPPPEGRLMGELLASGDVGYELSLDPVTPIVVGVYPMRPVPRG